MPTLSPTRRMGRDCLGLLGSFTAMDWDETVSGFSVRLRPWIALESGRSGRTEVVFYMDSRLEHRV